MPNPHFDVQIISRGASRNAVASSAYRSGSRVAARSAGRGTRGGQVASSVVAAASYRSGDQLYDVRADKVFDYRQKEDVLYCSILTPDGAPIWASDRELLWNRVETTEKRRDAQLARDIIAALPRELTTEQQIALVESFVQTQFVARGMVADIAVHDKIASDGGQQPHCHIMLTMRDFEGENFGKKNRAWNDKKLVTHWRTAWSDLTNQFLEASGSDARLDLRSYREQGIDREPGEHIGYDADQLERRGVETKQGNRNREITHGNQVQDIVRSLGDPDAHNEENSEIDAAKREGDGQGAKLVDGVHQSEAQSGSSDTSSGDPLEVLHRQYLGASIRAWGRHVQPSIQRFAEQVNRLRDIGRRAVEKAKILSRQIAERYGKSDVLTPSAQREVERQQGKRQEGPER